MGMMIYTDQLATPGNSTTSGTPNTELDVIYFKAGAAGGSVGLQAVYVIGKGAGLTTISGISFRLRKYATGSTVGTAASIVPKDPAMQAATHTALTGGTPGTTATNQMIFGCGAAGPGGWIAPNPDSVIKLAPASTTVSLDMMSVSGTASMNFEFSCEIQEL